MTLGEELKKMFLQNGSFAAMEVAISKKTIRAKSQAKQGGWYSKAKLEGAECWSKWGAHFVFWAYQPICMHVSSQILKSLRNRDRTSQTYSTQLRAMIQKAWTWARNNQKLRVNSIHGEEEIFIVLSETFAFSATEQEEVERSGSIAVQE